MITRHGKPAAVVVGFAEWQRMDRLQSFGKFLMAAPIEEGDIPERDRSWRDLDL